MMPSFRTAPAHAWQTSAARGRSERSKCDRIAPSRSLIADVEAAPLDVLELAMVFGVVIRPRVPGSPGRRGEEPRVGRGEEPREGGGEEPKAASLSLPSHRASLSLSFTLSEAACRWRHVRVLEYITSLIAGRPPS